MKCVSLILVLFLFSSVLLYGEESASERENLGANINTEYAESYPVISPDGKTLYFTRKYSPDNTGGGNDPDDIWVSHMDENGVWSKAENLGAPLNNKGSNFVCAVMPDGNTLLLANVYDEGGRMLPGVSMSHRTVGGWSFPEPLEIQNFYNISMYVSFYLSNDGKTLLLALSRSDSRGDLDLYVSFLENNGSWSEPLNLGSTINTSEREGTPFLAADGVTLYFSSAGHEGYGKRDVFISRRLDETWQNWMEPKNLGPEINTASSDIYYMIPASGEEVYFVSQENSLGRTDIFRLKAPEEGTVLPVIMVSGRVVNKKDEKPLEAKIIYEILPEGAEVGIARSEPENGNYKIILPGGKKYGFRAEAVKGEFYGINDNIDATDITGYTEIVRDLFLIPVAAAETLAVRINNLFFNFDEYELLPESFPELNRLAEILKENPERKVEIAGHTDSMGPEYYNQELSLNRAQAVVDHLVSKGCRSESLIPRGYGESKPIAGNETEQDRALNRRVEFKFIK